MTYRLAKKVAPFSDPDLVTVGWNDCAVGPPRQDLYDGGYCGECGSPVGARNDRPVRLARAPKAEACGFEERMSPLSFVSETILAALSADEVGQLRPREVAFEKPSANRRRLFEVTGAPRLRQVGVRGGEYWRLACFECATCGYRAFACAHPRLADKARAGSFVARADLDAETRSFFLLADALGRTRIAMGFARFEAFAAALPGVALWPGRLFCLADDEVERHPDLPPRSTLA